MRRVAFWAVRWGLAGALAAVAVAFVRPGDRALVLDAFVLFAGALALRVLVHAIGVAAPVDRSSPFETALSVPAARPSRPEDLERIERAVLLALEGAAGAHVRLRPTLREIAEHRLSSAHGVELESARAEELLGAAWPLVRPETGPAARSDERLPAADLHAAVATLERI